MTDKNGTPIKSGNVVIYDQKECKVLFSRGKKIILKSHEAEMPLHVHAKSLKDKITNIEVIQ